MSYPKSQNDEKRFYPDEKKNETKWYPAEEKNGKKDYPDEEKIETEWYPAEEKNGKKDYPDALNTNETEWYPKAKETIETELIPKIDRTKYNFILLAGFPGAGKSSVILPLLKDELGKILENNLFIISGDNGENNDNIVYKMGSFTKFKQIFTETNETKEKKETNIKLKTPLETPLETLLKNKKIILIDKPFLTIKDEIIELKTWIEAIKGKYAKANIFVIYLNIP